MDAHRAATARLGFRLFLAADVLVLATMFFAVLQPGARPEFRDPGPPLYAALPSLVLVAVAALWRDGRRHVAALLLALGAAAIGAAWRGAGMRRGMGLYSGAVVGLGWWLALHLGGAFAAMLARRRAAATPLLDDFLLVLAPCAVALHLLLFVVL